MAFKKTLCALIAAAAIGFIGCKDGGNPSPSSPRPAQTELTSVLLVERDVPQTRVDFDPVINHEALVVNLSDKTIEVDIESQIPKGLYVVKKFFPAFGEESLLAMPMYYPQEVNVSDYKILQRPSIEEKKDGEAIFSWNSISILPKQAIIAQYDNYFGNLGQFYTKDGLKVLELFLRTSYTASLKEGGKVVAFELNYDLENKGKSEIEDIVMDIILPDEVYPEGENSVVKLFEVTEAYASPNIKVDRGMLGDGFGKAATGTIFTVRIGKIKPGESHKLSMKVEGKRMAERGESYPLFTFQYRTKGDHIWPPTTLKSKKELEITKFYYKEANIILPDSKLFRFKPEKIEVVPVGVGQDYFS